MTVGSLFAGIGGLDLGLERAGHRVLWQVESNAFCRRILAQHWPDIPCYPDVKLLTGEELEPVDLLCGGFPCQPVSHAGKQKGTDDDRWLWPEFHRLIDVLRPRYALLENVPGLLTANGGHAFGAILADLAERGYDAEWDHLPAAAVGAPHLRYRVFIIAVLADADGSGCHPTAHAGRTLPPASGEESREPQFERVTQTPDHRRAGTADVADAQQFNGGARSEAPRREAGTRSGRSDRPPSNRPDVADADRGMRDWGTDQPGRGPERRVTADGGGETLADADAGYHTREDGAVCPRGNPTNAGRQAGTSRFFDAPIGGNWTTEPDVGRVAHGVPHRVDRLKALGNAVVPQVAEWIGRRLNDAS